MEKVAGYGGRKIETLLHDGGIVRNRKKIESAIKNAQVSIAIQEKFGSLDAYFWEFVRGKTIVNSWTKLSDVPTTSLESDALSKDLKGRGMAFVGSTIMYAMMQAAGLVNDHIVRCFRHKQLVDSS